MSTYPHPDAVAAAGRLAPLVTHRTTDPACVHHRPPITRAARRAFDLARGKSCPVCLGRQGAVDLEQLRAELADLEHAQPADEADDLTALARAAGVFRPSPAPDYDDLGARRWRRAFGEDTGL